MKNQSMMLLTENGNLGEAAGLANYAFVQSVDVVV